MSYVHILTNPKGGLVAVIHGEPTTQTKTLSGRVIRAGILVKADQKLTKVALDETLKKASRQALHEHFKGRVRDYVG